MAFIKDPIQNGHKRRVLFAEEGEGKHLTYPLKCLLRAAVEETLFYERFFRNTEISLTICDNETIQGLNREHRQKDKPTDVLSFPQYLKEEIEEEKNSAVSSEFLPLGDIVISWDKVEEQALALGHSPMREAAFLTIHSTLHLLGYDHELSPEDEEEMCKKQKTILEHMTIEGE